jgi:large subunit ribosomal protein L21
LGAAKAPGSGSPLGLHFLTGVYGPVITAPIGVFDAAISAATPPTVSRTDWKNPVRAVTRASGLVVEDLERGTNMFAVFKTGGKQYRVAAEDVLKVGKVKGEPGEIVEFGEVLVVGGDSVSLGAPTVAGATVAAEVLDQARGPKIIAFKKRRRKNSRRKIGHRQEFTLLRITEILTDGKKPSKQAQPRPKRAPAASASEQSAGAAAAATSAEDGAPTARKIAAKKEKSKAKPAAKNKKPARTKSKKK